MATVRISELPEAGAVEPADDVAVVQDGETRRAPGDAWVARAEWNDRVAGSLALTEDGKAELDGDEDAPSASRYYGTDDAGERGWHELPEGGGSPAPFPYHFRPRMSLPAGSTGGEITARERTDTDGDWSSDPASGVLKSPFYYENATPWWEVDFPGGTDVELDFTFSAWQDASANADAHITVEADGTPVGATEGLSGHDESSPLEIARTIPVGTEKVRVSIGWTNTDWGRVVIQSDGEFVATDLSGASGGTYLAGDGTIWDVAYDGSAFVWENPRPTTPRRTHEGAFPEYSYAVLIGDVGGETREGQVVIGKDAASSSLQAIAIGYGSAATAERAVAIGPLAECASEGGVSVGGVDEYAEVGGFDESNVSVGNGAYAGESAGQVVIGDGASTWQCGGGVAIGIWSYIEANNVVAVGPNAYAGHDHAVALGADVSTSQERQVAVGDRDIEIQPDDQSTTPRGLIIPSPDGTRWRITVDDNGDLQATAA